MFFGEQRGLHVLTLFGIPITLTASYGLGALLIVGMSGGADGLLWLGILTFSVLIHELGHGLVARAFQLAPRVFLTALGGFCAHLPPTREADAIFVVIAGPLASGLLAVAAFLGTLGIAHFHIPLIDRWPVLYAIPSMLMLVNVFLFVFNLLPMFPSDGGQLLRLFLLRVMPTSRALSWTHSIGVLVAAGGVAWALMTNAPILAMVCGMLALQNAQILAATGVGLPLPSREAKPSPETERLYREAKEALEKGDLREAYRLCHRLRKEPRVPKRALDFAWQTIAIAALDRGEHEEALDATARTPDTPEMLYVRLRSLLGLGRLDEARKAATGKPFEAMRPEARAEVERALSLHVDRAPV